jgi:hypothetical protein
MLVAGGLRPGHVTARRHHLRQIAARSALVMCFSRVSSNGAGLSVEQRRRESGGKTGRVAVSIATIDILSCHADEVVRIVDKDRVRFKQSENVYDARLHVMCADAAFGDNA